jgi:hypothetical protein
MYIWIWIYGYGYMDMDIWIYGYGYMDMDIWIWIWIYGYMDMDIWIWMNIVIVIVIGDIVAIPELGTMRGTSIGTSTARCNSVGVRGLSGETTVEFRRIKDVIVIDVFAKIKNNNVFIFTPFSFQTPIMLSINYYKIVIYIVFDF